MMTKHEFKKLWFNRIEAFTVWELALKGRHLTELHQVTEQLHKLLNEVAKEIYGLSELDKMRLETVSEI